MIAKKYRGLSLVRCESATGAFDYLEGGEAL